MADVWRVTVGDSVKESASFTPLEGILKKLCNSRTPFKVGFGKVIEAVVPAGATHAPLSDAPAPDDDF